MCIVADANLDIAVSSSDSNDEPENNDRSGRAKFKGEGRKMALILVTVGVRQTETFQSGCGTRLLRSARELRTTRSRMSNARRSHASDTRLATDGRAVTPKLR